jgi:hypothetical protein
MGFETESFPRLPYFGSNEVAEDTDILVIDIILAYFVGALSCKGIVCWADDCTHPNVD